MGTVFTPRLALPSQDSVWSAGIVMGLIDDIPTCHELLERMVCAAQAAAGVMPRSHWRPVIAADCGCGGNHHAAAGGDGAPPGRSRSGPGRRGAVVVVSHWAGLAPDAVQ